MKRSAVRFQSRSVATGVLIKSAKGCRERPGAFRTALNRSCSGVQALPAIPAGIRRRRCEAGSRYKERPSPRIRLKRQESHDGFAEGGDRRGDGRCQSGRPADLARLDSEDDDLGRERLERLAEEQGLGEAGIV
jgi:hypothetical protein